MDRCRLPPSVLLLNGAENIWIDYASLYRIPYFLPRPFAVSQGHRRLWKVLEGAFARREERTTPYSNLTGRRVRVSRVLAGVRFS